MPNTDIKPNHQSVDLAIEYLNSIKSRIMNGEEIQVNSVTLDIKIRPSRPIAKKVVITSVSHAVVDEII